MSMNPVGSRIPQFHSGDRMAKARETVGLTQAQMAEEIGVSRRSLGRWEDTGVVKKSALLLYAMRTGVPVEWLATGVEPPHGGPDPENSQKITFWLHASKRSRPVPLLDRAA